MELILCSESETVNSLQYPRMCVSLSRRTQGSHGDPCLSQTCRNCALLKLLQFSTFLRNWQPSYLSWPKRQYVVPFQPVRNKEVKVKVMSSALSLTFFSPGKKTPYPFHRRLGGPQGWSGRMQKISPAPGFDSWIPPIHPRYPGSRDAKKDFTSQNAAQQPSYKHVCVVMKVVADAAGPGRGCTSSSRYYFCLERLQ